MKRSFTKSGIRQYLQASSQAELKGLQASLSDWQGHAAIDFVAYRFVREYRLQVRDRVWASLESLVKDKDAGLSMLEHRQLDGPLWDCYSSQHPLSRAVPQISWLLDMPAEPQSGESFLPKVAGKNNGASERFAVSPGKEELGYFHMSGGQSGHPLLPYYGTGHDDWHLGKLMPFLPMIAQQSLMLGN